MAMEGLEGFCHLPHLLQYCMPKAQSVIVTNCLLLYKSVIRRQDVQRLGSCSLDLALPS